MASEKDRLGQKLRDAEKGREDQYFAERDKQLIEKAKRAREEQFADELKAAAQMLCPRCGGLLRERIQHGVTTDECPDCGGLWLDKGELEALAQREGEGWFGRLFRSRQTDKP